MTEPRSLLAKTLLPGTLLPETLPLTLCLGACLFLAGCNSGSRADAGGATSAPLTSSRSGGGTAPVPSSAPTTPPVAPPPSSASYDPAWAALAPTRVIPHPYDATRTAVQNGAALAAAIQGLQPGDRLEIASGTYSIEAYFNVTVQGTSTAPIWIVAASGATPVITRSNANQNVINVGSGSPVRFLCLRGLEITGGSALLRLYDCEDVWVDQCHLHDSAEVAITANTADTARLHLTRNEIHATGGTGEGMYLGGNNASVVMRDSVIALNHVYDCGGSQGDGIEVKQGSFGNWIVENHVHDTNYPAITVYGTGGQPRNVIERNTCYRSNDNVLQVQGEALVRDNLVVAGAGSAFHTHDHQGQTQDLVVVHNTFVNTGRGMNLISWGGRSGMVLANNAIYSQGEAVRFGAGSAGVTLSGNVVFGSVSGAGSLGAAGTGLGDFADLAWDASKLNARPATSSPLLGAGDVAHVTASDLTSAARQSAVDAGCYDAP